MADSLVGAIYDSIDDASKAFLDTVMAGVEADTVETTTFPDDAGVVVTGTGSMGEKQTVLIANDAIETTVDDGVFSATVQAPAKVRIQMEGIAEKTTADEASSYMQGLVDIAIPPDTADANPAAKAQADSIKTAVEVAAAKVQGDAVVKVIHVDASSVAAGEKAIIDMSGSSSEQMNALVLGGSNAEVVLKGTDAVVVVGEGKVQVDNPAGAIVVGDNANQDISGGSGNDTLVGGSGNDTLTGGDGSDAFGFIGIGHFTISGFGSGDSLNFDVEGINSLEDLIPLVTGVVESESGVTFQFGESASITLLGVTAADVTADMVLFTI